MRYKVFFLSLSYFIVFLSCLGLLLVAANVFTRNHILRFHRPAVGDEFRMSSECVKNSEALLIALSAAPHLFEWYDFGLVEAVDSISKDDCFPRSPQALRALTVDAVATDMSGLNESLSRPLPFGTLGNTRHLHNQMPCFHRLYSDTYMCFPRTIRR